VGKKQDCELEIMSARQIKQSWFLYQSERIKKENNKRVCGAFFFSNYILRYLATCMQC
jgi:hypothetical protein